MKNIINLRLSAKQNNGITLIALVITVIILLILAGVTIAGLTGEKGIIKEAKTAAELTELASLEEQVELAIIKAEQKHRNPSLNDVIEELKNHKVISKDDQVDTETGAIKTDAGYEIKGKLDDYLDNVSTGDGNTTGNNTTGGNQTGNNTGDGNTTEGGTTNPPEATLPSTDNTKPFLPEGATQVEGTNLDTGLVIKDSNNNEWVWVEVPKSIYNATTTNKDYTAIEQAMQTYASDYRISSYSDTFYNTEQHGFSGATEYNDWKNSMLESVFTNGGFYIGRYEAGSQYGRYAATDLIEGDKPVMRNNYITPYNFVTCSQAQTLSKQLATGGKTSSLLFGIQWDLTLKFIEEKGAKTQAALKTNSGSWGNYSNVTFKLTNGLYTTTPTKAGSWKLAEGYTKSTSTPVLLTIGASDRNSVLNIYDLAGNVWEWTLEYSSNTSTPCTVRGGCYKNSSNNAATRGGYSKSQTDYFNGFRAALW